MSKGVNQTSPSPKCDCLLGFKFREQTTSSSQHQRTREHGSEFETSSSSSTLSEHFPIKLKLKMKTLDSLTTSLPVEHDDVATETPLALPSVNVPIPETRPERLQPSLEAELQFETRPVRLQPTLETEPQFLTPQSPTSTEEEYYSCNCESSDLESEKIIAPKAKPRQRKTRKQDRNRSDILELLHEVIHLLEDEKPPTDESQSNSTSGTKSSERTKTASTSSSSKCQKPELTKCDTCGSFSGLGALIEELREELESCGPCADLRILLAKLKNKRAKSQTTSDDLREKGNQTLSTTTDEIIEGDCNCTKESTESESANIKPQGQPCEQTFVPPWPCCCYFMALLASARYLPVPISTPPVRNLQSPVFPMPQHEDEVDKCNCNVEKHKLAKDDDTCIEIIADNETCHESPVQHDHLKGRPSERSIVAKGIPIETPEGVEKLLNIEHSIQPAMEVVASGTGESNAVDYVEQDSIRITNICADDLTNAERSLDIEPYIPQDKIQYQQQIVPYEESYEYSTLKDQNEDYFIDELCDDFDEDCELEKEKRTELLKRKADNGSCDCSRCREKCDIDCRKSVSFEGPQSINAKEGVNEFKYFIDSIILDLDAMEHARRKCDVLKNICKQKSLVCTRESFPVTIAEVQELGASSLYVKWTIHDCYGIGGYEIYVDGYLTNRYYHSRHEAAVITDVDVTIPHKIALVAQPSLRDDCLKMLCSHPSSKCKSLTTSQTKQRTSFSTPAGLWTPSIYLYDPAAGRALTAP